MVDTRLKQLEEAQTGMAREMSELRLAVNGQQKLMQEVLNQVSSIGSQLKSPLAESSRSKSVEVVLSSHIDGGNPVILRHKPASVKLSRFSGEHPDAWVFQVERHFTFYSILPEQQLSLASFYLDRTALEWELEDPEGRLAKLYQTSTVFDYQARFEAIANETEDMPDTLMVKLFISGLRLDIKTNVLVHKPGTLDEAISLAHTHEQRLNLEKGPMQPACARTQPLLPNPQSRSLSPSRNTDVSFAKFPIKRLSSVEMQQRWEKGLCYYCDKKYVANHRSPNLPRILLLKDDSDPLSPALDGTTVEKLLTVELQGLELQAQSTISYHALAEGHPPTILHFKGHIQGSPITILVDGGSTHNFIQTRATKFLNLTVTPITNFAVVVGNG
ncbi:hypothetical protein FXO37_30196 [Capsicum annuum]|nr:hypothetical protein FXO37_30196 [Capsicum annuum]